MDHDEDHDDLEGSHQLQYRNHEDKDTFPNVNAPSLELSRTNTPRMSTQLREHTGFKSKQAKSKYTQNLPEQNERPQAMFGTELPKNLSTSKNRLYESLSSRVSQLMSKERAEMHDAIAGKDHQLQAMAQKLEEMEDYIQLLKSKSTSESELIHSRILQKIKTQREMALESEQKKETQLKRMSFNLKQAQTEIQLLSEAFEDEIKRLNNDLDNAKVLASSYKAQEAENGQQIEKLKQELLSKDRNIENMILRMQEKDRDVNEVKLYLRDCEIRINDLKQALGSREAELEETINENVKLKEHLEELMQQPEKKVQRDEVQLATLDDDDRAQYEWTINELKKQLATQAAFHKNGTQSRKSQSHSEKGLIFDGTTSQHSEISRQVSTADKSEECMLLEKYFMTVLELTLKQANCFVDSDHEYSMGEMQALLIRLIRDLTDKNSQVLQENDRLRQKVETYRSKAAEEAPRESISMLANQLKLMKDENDNLRNKLQSQREEISELKVAISQRSTAKTSSQKTGQHKSSAFTQTVASVARSRDSVCQTDQPRQADFMAMVVDESSADKIKHLEKTVKEARHDVSVKSKLIRELEAQKASLEEELRRLKSQSETEVEARKKAEQLEKKVGTLSQDLSSKDKKNIELFDTIKKLKAENESLRDSIKANAEKSFSSKLSSKRTQSTSKPLESSRQLKVPSVDIDAHVKKVNDEVKEAQTELAELYKKVRKSHLGRRILR